MAFMSGISLPTSLRTHRMEGNLVRGILQGKGKHVPVKEGVWGGSLRGEGSHSSVETRGPTKHRVDEVWAPTSTLCQIPVLCQALLPKQTIQAEGAGGRQRSPGKPGRDHPPWAGPESPPESPLP